MLCCRSTFKQCQFPPILVSVVSHKVTELRLGHAHSVSRSHFKTYDTMVVVSFADILTYHWLGDVRKKEFVFQYWRRIQTKQMSVVIASASTCSLNNITSRILIINYHFQFNNYVFHHRDAN